MMMVTAERLREVLSYDPMTGVFVWKTPTGRRIRVGSVAGTVNPDTGYRIITIDRRMYPAHRLAWLYEHGQWPPSALDHKNRIRDDNRMANLRPATRSQNRANSATVRNKSGFKGAVAYGKRHWQARIVIDGKSRNLGVFDTPAKAHAAYVSCAKAHFGEFFA
jgi:hypothetical protein